MPILGGPNGGPNGGPSGPKVSKHPLRTTSHKNTNIYLHKYVLKYLHKDVEAGSIGV
jgi:hypothetical protein